MTLAPQIEAMKHIASRARALRTAALGMMRPKSTPSQPTVSKESAVNICSSPQSISADLIALGLRSGPASKISSAYQRTALRFKAHVEERYATTLQQLQSVPGDSSKTTSLFATALATQYIRTLESWRSAIIDEARLRVRELRDVQLRRQTPARRAFNTSATPILERFFEHNTRPSRTEKQRLAAQTNMAYKQINVWFQNRRNRSKKGMPVDCSPGVNSPPGVNGGDSLLPPDLATALARILDQYIVSEESAITDDQCDSTVYIPSFGPFDTDRPQHAFPVCYPPLCSYNPFPISHDTRRFSTPWHRTPVRSPVSHGPADATDLLALLDKWSLAEEMKQERRDQRTQTCADVGFATRPPPAPLPALLRISLSTSHRSEGPFPCCAQPAGAETLHISDANTERVSAPAEVRSSGPSRRRAAGVSPSVDNVPRRRRGRTHPLIDPPLTTPDNHASSSNESHSAFLDPALLGRPYPKGKPSRGKASAPTRNVPKASRRANARAAQASASVLLVGQSPDAHTSIPSSPPSSLPALSRESSISSIRSVSSASSTDSIPDLLLTPPMLPASVLDYPVPDTLTLDLCGYTDDNQLKATIPDTPFDEYLGHPIDFAKSDLNLGLSSALYSDMGSIVPFFPDVPAIPSIASSSLAF